MKRTSPSVTYLHDYERLMAGQAAAWQGLMASKRDGHYQLAAFVAWMTAARLCAEARGDVVDQMLKDDPQLAIPKAIRYRDKLG